jgi:hypothetical protein
LQCRPARAARRLPGQILIAAARQINLRQPWGGVFRENQRVARRGLPARVDKDRGVEPNRRNKPVVLGSPDAARGEDRSAQRQAPPVLENAKERVMGKGRRLGIPGRRYIGAEGKMDTRNNRLIWPVLRGF